MREQMTGPLTREQLADIDAEMKYALERYPHEGNCSTRAEWLMARRIQELTDGTTVTVEAKVYEAYKNAYVLQQIRAGNFK